MQEMAASSYWKHCQLGHQHRALEYAVTQNSVDAQPDSVPQGGQKITNHNATHRRTKGYTLSPHLLECVGGQR